jgi:hypothetical protein
MDKNGNTSMYRHLWGYPQQAISVSWLPRATRLDRSPGQTSYRGHRMKIQVQPPSDSRRPPTVLTLEVHPDADHTGTLTLDDGSGRPCEVALPKSYTTLLLALALARIQDQRNGRCAMVGCRMREKLALIYGALPGAIFGRIDGQHLSGYKSRLIKLIKRSLAEYTAAERVHGRQARIEMPPLFAETRYGQGYCLGFGLELRGVDVEEMLERVRSACV